MPVPTNSYNDLIPQATNLLSNSQLALLNNFGAIKTLVDVDHVDFANAAGGQHNKVTLFNQGSLPVFSPLGVVGMYSAADARSGQNELYINKTNASGIVQIPSTESILGTTAAPTPGTYGNTGWTMLPSGIKLAWGTFAGNGSSSQTVTLAGASAFTQILSVQLTIISTNTTFAQSLARLVSIGATSFVAVVSTPGGTAFTTTNAMYLAIGY